MSRGISFLIMACAALAGRAVAAPAEHPAAPTAEQLSFFESKIRPVLVEQCYKCHSAKSEKLKGNLLLDSRAGLLKGGDSGPSVVPGDADKSLIIQALRYGDQDTAMPPKGKLPANVIADFETWVKSGVAWPAESGPVASGKKGPDYDRLRKEHWAYQPIKAAPAPAVKDANWPAGEIDRFILAKLEAQGIKPNKEADKSVLVRRVYFDLTGLPPTPQQIDEFLKDPASDAYEKLVDRLLASPAFGERFGRHWLDVARYAESLTLRGFILKDTWRYRDYVIETFNQDRPFNQFIREQVSGDLMPAADNEAKRRQMTGTTFLAMGNTNLEEQDKKQLRMDVVDEQLETVGKAFLAQTIGCARCHDHKFDPIPTADYYALAGIFRNAKTLEHSNVSKWLEVPLPEDPAREAELKKHESAVAMLDAQIKRAKAAINKPAKGKAAKSVIAAKDLPGVVVDDLNAVKVGEWKQSTSVSHYIGEGYIFDENSGKGEKTVTFTPELPHAGKYEVRLAYQTGTARANNVPVTIFSADGEKEVIVNQKEAPPIDGLFISLGQYNFEKNGQGYVLVSNEGTKGVVDVDAVQFIPVELLTDVADGTADGKAAARPTTLPTDPTEIKKLEAELKQMTEAGPKRTTVISVVEEKEIGDTQVHIRGNVGNLGAKVPRGFLSCVAVSNTPKLPSNQSGRLELGQWLADPSNPLPARVMANRTWHWLMGQGIVRTVDNFGTTGEMPSHPELLEYLSNRFIQDGWSVKKLVRQIVLSRAYRLSSQTDGKSLAADPENRLHWRMDRRRLDAECIRDAMLSVSGQLDHSTGGPSYKNVNADYNYRHTDTRRSVYSSIFRNSVPEIFEAFDFADPSMVVGRRNTSTVAPQALFMMNNPFVRDQAKAAAKRLLADPAMKDDMDRLKQAYRETLGRETMAYGELQVSLKRLANAGEKPADKEAAWTDIFHALFASMDFRYVE